jgi:translation elongation factor EF-G
MRLAGGIDEPPRPDEPSSYLTVHMIVPEEFAGMSMAELNSRGGSVTGIEVQTGNALIRALLPASEYGGMKQVIEEATQHRGTLEQAKGQ